MKMYTKYKTSNTSRRQENENRALKEIH